LSIEKREGYDELLEGIEERKFDKSQPILFEKIL